MKRRIFSLLLAFCLVLSLLPFGALAADPDDPEAPTDPSLLGEGECGENVFWTLSEDGVLTVTGTGDMESHPWRDDDATREAIRSVVIEEGVTSISRDAFIWCPNLTDVTTPSTVRKISSGAFMDCDSLSSITIPAGVTEIGADAFSYCDALTSIQVAPENASFASVDGVLFSKDGSELVQYPAGRSGAYTVPDGVTEIRGFSFRGCAGLTELTLPEGVERIGEIAFDGCDSLTAVSLPDSLLIIESSAFVHCYALQDVTIPAHVERIEADAFYLCSSLADMEIPASVSYIGPYAFTGCASLKDFRVAEDNPSYKSVNGVLFSKDGAELAAYPCGRDGAYTIQYGVTSIADGAFSECAGLTDVTIPDSVTSLGARAFSLSGLKSVTIPGSILEISDHAFESCWQLTSVTLSEGTVTIGNYVFAGNQALTAVTIPASVTEIRYGVFSNCNLLHDVWYAGTIEQWNAISISDDNDCLQYAAIHCADGVLNPRPEPTPEPTDEPTPPPEPTDEPTAPPTDNLTWSLSEDGVLTISGEGDMVLTPWRDDYTGLQSIRSVVIEEGVTSICPYAFSDCRQLTSVTIPSTVREISSGAFMACDSLSSITIPAGVTEIGIDAFSFCGVLTSIQVAPENASFASVDGVLFSKDGSELVQYPAGRSGAYTVPDGVTGLRAFSFRGCAGLTELTLPEGVVRIGETAFDGCRSLTAVSLPDSLLIIESSAFFNCSALQEVTIPAHVERIEADAFYCCISLADMEIPASVSYIGPYAFTGCASLKDFRVAEDNPSYKAVGGVLFSKDGAELAAYPCGRDGAYTIPDGVTSLGAHAFSLSGLKSVTIPGSIREISDGAFESCWQMTSVTLSEGTVTIGNYAFAGSQALTDVTIPASVTEIRYGVFSDCNLLHDVWYADTIEQWNAISISYDNDRLQCAAIHCADGTIEPTDEPTPEPTDEPTPEPTDEPTPEPTDEPTPEPTDEPTSEPTEPPMTDNLTWSLSEDGVLTISGEGNMVLTPWKDDYTVFRSIRSVVIEEGVTSICYEAFSDCRQLTSVTIPSSVTVISYSAFADCTGLTNVTIPEGVTEIRHNAFNGCTGLTSVLLPASVTAVAGAFPNCSALTAIEVADDNPVFTSVDGVLFSRDGSELAAFPAGRSGEYTIPQGVTSLAERAFCGCAGLTDVTIPDGVENMGTYVFSDCTGLTSVSLPLSVTEIPSGTFSSCSSLADVTIPETAKSVGWEAFYGCSALTDVTIPAGVTFIADTAFQHCSSLTRIDVASENQSYSSADGVLFSKDGTNLISYPCGRQGAYTIPDGVTSISVQAFLECDGLTAVTMPEGVTAPEWGTFYGCRNLRSVTLPESLVSIPDWMFLDCDSLSDVWYAGTIEQWNAISISGYGNDRLQYAAIHCADGTIEPAMDPSIVAYGPCGENVNWYKYSYGTLRIAGVGEMTSSPVWMDLDIDCIEVGAGVTTIADEAFCYYENLSSVSISDTVTVIGERAFEYCPNIQRVHYSGTVAQWNAMQIGSGNDSLTSACIYCADGNVNVPVVTGELVLCDEAPEGAVEQVRSYRTTRAGVMELLYDVHNGTITDYRPQFKDVDGLPQKQLDAINWAYWYGLANGYGNGEFRPSGKITRSVLATILCRAAGGSGAGMPNPYQDVEYHWGQDDVVWSSAQDWLEFWSSDPAYFHPDESVSRITATVYVDPADETRVLGLKLIRVDDPSDPAMPEPCGNTAEWQLDENGVLTITGTGAITSNPWCNAHQLDVKRVVIAEGITSIPNSAFSFCSNLTSVELPASLEHIDYAAFTACGSPAEVVFAGTRAQWSAVGIEGGNGWLDSALIQCADGVYLPTGACGDDLTWTLQEDGTLLITGTGEMTSSPWTYRIADKVKAVVLSEGVTSISDGAFWWHSNLASVTIPASLERIGENVFYGCSALTSFFVAPDSETFAAVDGVLFDKACASLVQYPAGKGESYTVPDGVTSIGSGAFRSCSALTELTLPADLERVEYNAFPDCYGLTDVYYPGTQAQWSAVEVADFNDTLLKAFIHCQDGVINPSGQCGDDAYWTMDENGVVTITGIGALWDRYTDGETPDQRSPLSFDPRIRSVVIEPGVTRIGGTAFYGCENLEQVSIPDTVTEIGYFAFDGCTSLTSVVLPDRLTRLEQHAFGYCGSLTSVTIPGSVETMESAFSDCTGLTSVTILPGVRSIGYGAFAQCPSLTSVSLPTSLERIGDNVFQSCTGLTSVTIPENVTEIGDYVFHQCANLTSIDIPSSVRSIGSHAFDETPISANPANWIDGAFYYDSILMRAPDENITSYAILPGTRLIAAGAFSSNHYALEQVTIPEGVVGIGRSAFSGCWSMKSVSLPESLEYIGIYAFVGCDALQRVTIPAGVTYIGDGAFLNCNALTAIEVAPGNACFVFADGVLFTKDLTELVLCLSSKNGAYAIPDGTLRIRASAFNGCRNLTSISIPDSVSEIGASAFSSCGITSLVIPEGVTKLPAEMCMACDNLESVTIPVSVTEIDNSMFGCFGLSDSLKDVYYAGTKAQWNEIRFISYAGGFHNAVIHYLGEPQPFEPIVSQPEDQTVALGANAVFTVVTQGEGLTYQWQYCQPGKTFWYNSSADGAATDTLTIPATAKRDGQRYRCVISNAAGESVTSKPATLTILVPQTPLTITAQPTDQTVALGANAVFTVEATGEGLTYQWQYAQPGKTSWFDSSAAGAATDTLTIQATAKRDGQRYRCVITDAAGESVTSDPATLTILVPQTPLTITAQPTDQTVALGANATFTVEATGEGLTYQWQYAQPGKTSWFDSSAAGATTDTLTIQATAKRDGQRYRCVITDAAGNQVISDPATLTIGTPQTIEITAQPADQTVPVGTNAVFTVQATGEGLTYQWQYCQAGKNSWYDSSAAGAATNSLTIAATAKRDGQRYRCVITDAAGNQVISDPATLTIGTPQTIEITAQPADQTVPVGTNAVFTVEAQGEGLTYQWQYCQAGKNSWYDSSAAGAATDTLTIAATAKRDGQRYRCVITDAAGNQLISDPATLHIG